MNQRNPPPARSGPARDPVRARASASPVAAMAAAAARFVGRRPGFVLAAVAVAGGSGVFGWNALMKQPGAHPAPLFASAKAVAVPLEPPRRPDFQGTSYARAEPAAPRPVADQPPAKAQAQVGDTIGSIIRTGDLPKAAEAPAASKPAVDPKANATRILAVQKALLKAGYGPIEPDGVAGSITRQALERFERDRKLPVTGTLAPRTLKQLAFASGQRVE